MENPATAKRKNIGYMASIQTPAILMPPRVTVSIQIKDMIPSTRKG